MIFIDGILIGCISRGNYPKMNMFYYYTNCYRSVTYYNSPRIVYTVYIQIGISKGFLLGY